MKLNIKKSISALSALALMTACTGDFDEMNQNPNAITSPNPSYMMPYIQEYDAVLLENHGALTYSDTLMNAYHKMESLEFYARLMYQSKMIGGPQILDEKRVEELYEIRRNMNLSGKHPAYKDK